MGHTDWILESKLSVDNRVIASIDTKSVRLWDTQTGSQIINFKNVGFLNTSLSFHPDGNYIAVGSDSKHIKIWDVRSRKLAQDYLMPSEVNAVDFHPSGVVLACANTYHKALNNSSLNVSEADAALRHQTGALCLRD